MTSHLAVPYGAVMPAAPEAPDPGRRDRQALAGDLQGSWGCRIRWVA